MTPAEQHAADAARFGELVESASPGDWQRQSPVADWTARDVVEHLLEWLPGFLERTPVRLSAVDAAGDLSAAWRRRSAEVQRLLEERGDEEFVSPMFGTITVEQAIDQFYTSDVWAHTWDLGRALRRDVDLDEERCAAALVAMEPMDAVLRDSGQFGPKVEVPADATAQDRFIGFIGRDPSWTAPG